MATVILVGLAVLVLVSTVVVLSACALSSRISRQEEARERRAQ